MAQCDLSLCYPSCKSEERPCKVAYPSSWCSVCEKESQARKRCRSENDSYGCGRRRNSCWDSKLALSRWHRECGCENMDLEYDTRHHDNSNASQRIRSNLCELPTTYITNNCQSIKLSPSCQVSDFIDIAVGKGARCNENNLKSSDNFYCADQNFGSMVDSRQQDRLSKLYPKIEESAKNIHGIANRMNAPRPRFTTPTSLNYSCNQKPHVNDLIRPISAKPSERVRSATLAPVPRSRESNRTYDTFATKFNRNVIVKANPLRSVQTMSAKVNLSPDPCLPAPPMPSYTTRLNGNTAHDSGDFLSLQYDTATYFDKKMDIRSLKERYILEAELLKERLRDLKNVTERETLISPHVRGYVSSVSNNTQEHRQCIKEDMAKFLASTKKLEISSQLSHKSTSQSTKQIVPSTEKLNGGLDSSKSKVSIKVSRKIKSKLFNSKIKRPSPAHSNKNSSIKLATALKDAEENSSECSGSEDSDRDGDDVPEDTQSVEDLSSASSKEFLNAENESQSWPIRVSLFPNVAPYMSFLEHSARKPQVIPAGGRLFKWKLSTITPVLIRKTINNSGFRLVRSELCQESNEWIGTWGKHMKSPLFKTLKYSQKLNHFPGTFQIGRKDRLWRNFHRMISRFGHKEFGFIPQSYVLPQDLRLLKSHWFSKLTSGEERYIIKPPASARGTGIKVINRWSQLPKRMSLVVQEYISNPYLINGSKFDLRLYVLVTSFNPLRIYLYPEGLARFASVPYSSDSKDLRDKYMHLTNYSINKLSPQYTANENANACKGHKWTITKLFEYMEKRRQVDTKALWKRLRDLVIKTMLVGEASIVQLCKENMVSRYNCYELFGIDVLLDDALKCWLLEVNISPSLHSQSPLDEVVKGPMVKTLLNLAQFHLPHQLSRLPCKRAPPASLDARLYTIHLTPKENKKHSHFNHFERRDDYLCEILTALTGDDVRHLVQAEDEIVAMGEFERIFPTARTYKYLDFMEPRYYNRLFDAWENKYEKHREKGIKLLQELCEQKLHLKVAAPPPLITNLPNTNQNGERNIQEERQEEERFQLPKISDTPTLVVPLMVAHAPSKTNALSIKAEREIKCLYDTLCLGGQVL